MTLDRLNTLLARRHVEGRHRAITGHATATRLATGLLIGVSMLMPGLTLTVGARVATAAEPGPSETATPEGAPSGAASSGVPSGASGQATARATGAPALSELLARITLRKATQTRFNERKFIKVLDEPVDSSGVLRYEPPGRLEKRTEKPLREAMLIDGNRLSLERDGRRRTMTTEQLPGVGSLVGGLRDTLAGDEKALAREFRIVVTGTWPRWQMSLLPSTVEGARLVSRIDVRGNERRITEVETLQTDGDRSLMTLAE